MSILKTARRTLLTVALLSLALAAYRSVRLAAADILYRSWTPGSVRSAIVLEPGRALYYTGLGELEAGAGGDAAPILRQAVELKPHDAFIRMRLGLLSESGGDLEEAESQLLAAARVSRKFEPRWTLTNFYYRRGEEEQFWHWASEALAISFGNRDALLDLCWRMDPAGTRLAESIPDRRDVQLDYARFLLGKSQWRPAEQILLEEAVSATELELPGFLASIDQMFSAGQPDAAVNVWNSLAAGDVVHYPPIDTENGPWITNPDFSSAPIGGGFDWNFHRQSGIYLSRGYPAGLRIELTGRQPVECDIIDQPVVLRGGRAYNLGYRYRISNSGLKPGPGKSGLVWRITGLDGRPLAESSPMAATDGDSGNLGFRLPEGEGPVRLVLGYKRMPGEVRMEGTVRLERVTLNLQDTISAKQHD